MKNFVYKSGMLALFAGVLLTSCDPEIDGTAPSRGEADFATYVALGNSLTAGFQDAALYREGQENSYPAILAQQFQAVGGNSTFNQPLMAENVSAGTPGANGVPQALVLAPSTNCKGEVSLSPKVPGYGDMSAFAPPANQGPYNNLGVPGAKVMHLLAPGYGNPAGLATQPATANPFFVRFASSPNTSVLADAMAQKPTFFTLWIGNNDVLGYALSGGTGEEPTAPAMFGGAMTMILTQLAKDAKGAVANIPDVSKIPYFTTVPFNALELDADRAAQLSAYYKQMDPNTTISFKAGKNPFVIKEDGVVRQIKPTELILMTVPANQICEGLGSLIPIEDNYVLSDDELKKIKETTQAYNKILSDAANTHNLAYVDFNAYLNRLASGIKIDEVTYAPTMVTGNVFSLDGVHFTPRGAAIVANEFINAINAKYKANVPAVDITKYRAIQLP